MANTTKNFSERDANQTLQHSYNDIDGSLTTAGFLTGKVGRRVTPTISTTSIANDTITYTYSESGSTLYAIKSVYTDGTRTDLVFAERIS